MKMWHSDHARLSVGPREGWLSLLLLAFVVLTPAVSLSNADWVDDLYIVPQLAFFALLIGTVLSKLRVRTWVAHLFASEVGLALVGFYFAAGQTGSDWFERFSEVGRRIWIWLETAFSGGISNDTMLFALLMALLAWFLGYSSSWFAFRRHTVWFAILANGTALLVNLSYMLPSEGVGYFLVFILASMVLLIRSTLYERERAWHRTDAEYNRSIAWGFLWKGGALSAAIVALAWTLPTGTVNAAVAENWQQITGPWQGLQGEFDRLFASVGSSTAKVEGNRFTRTLALKGAIELGPELVMQVASPRAEYWAAQVYDRYTGQGWMTSNPQTVRLEANDERLLKTSQYAGRVDVEQRFRMLTGRNSTLFAATAPVQVSMPTNAESFGSLDDLAGLKSLVPMRSGYVYAVVSSVSVASAEELRRAGTDYPDWVLHYLQLPDDGGRRMSGASMRRVVSTARRLVSGATNPYDAAVEIERYLRGFVYEIKVASPPPDRDAVDWFLFTSKQGYCDYFASAMAVMARSIGIPARVVTGYNMGTQNEASGVFDIRQENAHSWPELFFPKYGWIRFEPTPSQPASSRPDAPPATEDGSDPGAAAGSIDELGADREERSRILLDDGMEFGISLGEEPSQGGWTGLPALAALAALAIVPLVALAVWRRGLSGLSTTEWAYLQMCAIAGLLGWRLRPSHTPIEYGRVLSGLSPDLGPDVHRVVGSYVEETYGGRRTPRTDEVRQAWRRARARLPLVLLCRRLRRWARPHSGRCANDRCL